MAETMKLETDFYVRKASGSRPAEVSTEPISASTYFPKGTVMTMAKAEALGIAGAPKPKSKPKATTKERKKAEDK